VKKFLLQTMRPYDPRLYWSLVGLNAVAVFALIPFASVLGEAYGYPGRDAPPGLGAIVADRIVTLIFIAVLARLGVTAASRIGLGLPYAESWIARAPLPGRFRAAVALGWAAGAGCGLLILALAAGVFAPPMTRMIREMGIEMPRDAMAPPWAGLLAAVAAGVNEETVFRLFVLSLLAWLGGFVFGASDGRPRASVLWTANVLAALAFGAVHLADANAIGLPMNALVLTRTFLLNGIPGLVFGWLFWRYGLESAMLAHFFTDVGLYALVPIVVMREGQTAKIVAGVLVTAAVVVATTWAARTIAREGERPAEELQASAG